ncbi:putative fungal specific transcription factor domain-containing protein [Diplodia seriata]|uniref:Putative fungal specific transcription factor domain-containing protein n=1 Tax=Diplodia seriata TaxID=420778 RepID=A0A0G2DR85_9PEZI|nr:putative fungal specific transcription factor domain-containing protein [Diplodia seriata]
MIYSSSCSTKIASFTPRLTGIRVITLGEGAIRLKIEKQWEELPPHFKLTASLTSLPHLHPFSRDFLAGTHLDYLHIHLLLGLVSSARSTTTTTSPDPSLLSTAGEMLSLAVEAIILRQNLVNSGTSLVAQYGLPAAGVTSLALLNPSTSAAIAPVTRSRMVQDLSVLVAEMRAGVLIKAGEPNFALFTRATRTIQSLLDSLMVWRPDPDANADLLGCTADFLEGWQTQGGFEPWEFEQGFWEGLAGHPTLVQER